MSKVVAVLNVIAWSGFWAFGFIALSADPAAPGQMTIAAVMAAVGAAMGLWAWFWIVRHSERTGYASKTRSRPRFDADTELDRDLAG
jgi:DMSO/TMAO reductase YedYZ heme-binding membrane subunit